MQKLAKIGGGDNYILQAPTQTVSGHVVTPHDGLIVINGEVMPLKYSLLSSKLGIAVVETSEDIVADGITYPNARKTRYAEYRSTYTAGVPNLYKASDFQTIQTNAQLGVKLADYSSVNTELAKKLTVLSYSTLTRTQLDGITDNCRINCRKGCVPLNGAEEYTVNIYRHSASNITQEQILPDNRRYVRYWNAATKMWGAFYPITDNLHIDVKVVKGTTVYVRHGFIPEGVQLVLLRKKKRSRKRRSGGGDTTNPEWEGKSMLRQPKNQYVHYKGIILSTAAPNTWYVPKCVGVTDTDDNHLIGKELGKLCEGLITTSSTQKPVLNVSHPVYKVKNTRVRCSLKAKVAKTQATCFARIALQFAAAGKSFKSAGGEMVRMKYRLWFDKVPPQPLTPTGLYNVRRCFSVE